MKPISQNFKGDLKQLVLYLSCLNYEKAEKEFSKFQIEDYQLILLKIIELRLSGIFIDFLKEISFDQINKEIFFRRFLERNKNITKRNLVSYNDCLKICNLFKERKLKHRFLKGVSLTLNHYENISQREIRDLDILIEEKDLSNALINLESIGFYSSRNPDLDLAKIKIDKNKYYDAPKLRNDNGTFVELHFALGKEKKELEKRIRSRILSKSRIAPIGKENIFVSDDISTFLHLLYHGVIKESFNPGPVLLTDIMHLMKTIDRQSLITEIDHVGLRKELLLIISIINKYSGGKYFCDDLNRENFLERNSAEIESSENLMINRKIANEFLPLLHKSLYERSIFIIETFIIPRRQIEHRYGLSTENSSFLRVTGMYLVRLSRIVYVSFVRIYKIIGSKDTLREIRDLRKLRNFIGEN